MPTYKIDSILQGLSSYFEEEPKTEEALAEFLDQVDVNYGNADVSLSTEEWETGLASEEAYNLVNYGVGTEEYWQNIFDSISRRFASSPSPSPVRATAKEPDVQVPEFSSVSVDYLSTTDSLLREIQFEEKGIDRKALIGLGEEQAQYLLFQGRQDEAADLLGNLSAVYEELGDQNSSNFALARAEFLWGNLKESDRLLGSVSSSSSLYSVAQELKTQIQPLIQREAHLEKVLPSIAALEQMRMRALEQLAFDESQIHDSWLEPDAWTDTKRDLNSRLISKVNRGINEMVQALLDGKVSNVEEAFAHFHEYTTLRTALDGNPPFDGRGFKQILSSAHVDVESLIGFSKIKGQKEREEWLLRYTEGLRSHYASLAGYPANTIERNLQALIESKNPAVKARAQTLYANVTGESATTGLSDAEFAGLLREGGKTTVPMVLAMMVAGPVGAYAEGAATVRLAAGGISLGRAGWAGRAVGFGVEATLFWGANDALHATLIGGGDYFTEHGLASSFLMLGGLKVLGRAWRATGGAYLAKAAQTNKVLAPLLGGVDQAGQLATEFSGFWGLGQLEEIIGLIPQQETTLRQELTQTAMTLMQLKMAVAAGQMVTGHLAEIKTLEIKLESTEILLREAAKRGSLTPAELIRALQHIEGLRTGLDRLKAGAVAPVRSEERRTTSSGIGERPTDSTDRERFTTVSWNDLGIPREDIDALFSAHESLPEEKRLEHGLHRLSERRGVVSSGEADSAESVLLEAGDELGDGTVRPSEFIAHIHGEDPLPSREDLKILSARARLNQGIPQVHTVFGYRDGERTFVQIVVVFDGTNTHYSFEISENLPRSTPQQLDQKASRIDQEANGLSQATLEQWAMDRTAQSPEEQVAYYEDGLSGLADPRAVEALKGRVTNPADRARILESWYNLWFDYVIEQHPELEEALRKFEVDLFTGTKSREVKTYRKEMRVFVDSCQFLFEEVGLSKSEVNQVMKGEYGPAESFVRGCRVFMGLGLTGGEVKTVMQNPLDRDIAGWAIGVERLGEMAKSLHPLLVREARDPVTSQFSPRLYREQAKLLMDTAEAVSLFGDQTLADDFLRTNQHHIINWRISDGLKRSALNTTLHDPSFIARGLEAFVSKAISLPGISEGTRSYLQGLQTGVSRRSPTHHQQAMDLLIVRNGVSRQLFGKLLSNPNCDGKFLISFMRESATALRNNNHTAPDFLKNVFENAAQSTETGKVGVLDGYLFELQGFNLVVNHGRLGSVPSSGYLRPDQLPPGVEHPTRDPENPNFVGVTYRDSTTGKNLTSGLDMDVILSESPPLSYVEIKRTVKRDDPKQQRQRAKIREATRLGLVSKPGCITSEIDPGLARALIADGTFEYILVMKEDPRSGLYGVTHVYGSNPRIGNTPVVGGSSPGLFGTTFPVPPHSNASLFPWPL